MVEIKDCIFCKIISGEIQAEKVYEDEKTFAFLDAAPLTQGHTLVISKEHHVNILDTPDEILQAIITTVKKITIAVKEAVKADGVNISMNNEKAAGQAVFHIHMHIIPRYDNDGFSHWKRKEGSGDNMKGVQEAISKALQS